MELKRTTVNLTWHVELQRTNRGDSLQVVGVGSFAQSP